MKARNGLAIGSIGLAVASAMATAAPAMADGRALLVGVNDYAVINDLNSAVNDSLRMRDFLTRSGLFEPSEIMSLHDEQATRAGILSAFNRLIDETDPGDPVVFFFAGHGLQIADVSGDEADGMDEALAPYDIDSDGTSLINIILDDDMDDLIRRLDDRDVTVIIDSCHSGTITRSLGLASAGGETPGATPRIMSFPSGAPPLSRSITLSEAAVGATEHSPIEPPENTFVWMAAAANQYAWETPRGGVFTESFIAGTEGQADRDGDGVVTSVELLDYLQNHSANWCASNPACAQEGLGLTPSAEGEDSRYFAPVLGLAGFGGGLPPALDALIVPPTAGGTVTAPVASAPPAAAPSDPVTFSTSMISGGREDVSIQITPSPSLRLGDRAVFRVDTTRPGYLILVDINADGQVTQLFPNDYSGRIDNWVGPNATVYVPDVNYPFEFVAAPPTGPAQLVAVVAEHQGTLARILEANATLAPVQGVESYLGAIAAQLREPVPELVSENPPVWRNRTQSFSATSTSYLIQ